MRTISSEQFKTKFGEGGISMFQNEVAQPTKQGNYFSNVAEQVRGNVREASQSLTASGEGRMNPFAAGANIAKNVSGAILSPVSQALKPIFDKTVTPLTDKIIGTQPAQRLIDVLSKNPELVGAIADTLETGLNVAGIEGTISAFRGGVNFAKGKVKDIGNEPPGPPGGGGGILETAAQDTSANIMNRVARLKPTDATAFEKMAGKTQGQYLKDTGNFGTPDQIIANEAVKFTNSLKEVDTAFSELPGYFRNGAIEDALNGLKTKAESISTGNVKAPYLEQVNNWLNKYKTTGLDMGEINAIKRLYERNVKLGYNKLINAEKVEQATNIDNAIREWQFAKAKELGFKNVDALNKQTQISKFLINKLGEQIIGKNGLNAVNLTDWVILAGGNPEAIAAFLTKKFFSSKTIQAQIAKFISDGKVQAPVKAEIGQSKVLGLPKPSGTIRSQISGSTPIRVAPNKNFEIINQ